jgi:hypothetical protein
MVEMQYRTYVTVVKGVLLHSTTSIIVLAVAITIVPSSNKSYSRQVVMRAVSLVLHRQCIAFKNFFESVKMAANTVPNHRVRTIGTTCRIGVYLNGETNIQYYEHIKVRIEMQQWHTCIKLYNT